MFVYLLCSFLVLKLILREDMCLCQERMNVFDLQFSKNVIDYFKARMGEGGGI